VAKAIEVCPDGNEGEPAADFFVISGYVTKGLSRLTVYLSSTVTASFTPMAVNVTQAFRRRLSFFFASPVIAIPAGIPRAIIASEFETNLKKPSEGSVLGELIARSSSISQFCAFIWEVKARKIRNTNFFNIQSYGFKDIDKYNSSSLMIYIFK
jgi:hypothetical protein